MHELILKYWCLNDPLVNGGECSQLFGQNQPCAVCLGQKQSYAHTDAYGPSSV